MSRGKLKDIVLENSDEIISLPKERAKRRSERKFSPAGKDEKFSITYTHFAGNQEKTEILTGDGREFDNDTLLEILGFEKDSSGILRLPAEDHEFDRDSKGNIIRMEEIRAIKAKKAATKKAEEANKDDDELGA